MNLIQNIKDIPGFEGAYAVTKTGKVWSYPKRRGSVDGKWLKQSLTSNGYLNVSLGRGVVVLVHRIVALTFLPNKLNKPCVNHVDGDKTNNDISNLGWVTYSENEKHSFRCLGKKPNKTALGKFGFDNPTSKTVCQYDLNMNFIKIWGSCAEAGRGGFLGAKVAAAARGEQKTHRGYCWKYLK